MSEIERTIPRLVRGAAQRFASRSAIEDGDLRLTFAELADASLEATRAFMAAGVLPGDRIAIWAPNIAEWVVAAIGLQSAGAVLVPLNTRLKGSEAGYILAKSGARVLCTVGEFLDTDYIGLLLGALGGRGEERPIAELPSLEQIVTLREPVSVGARETGAMAWDAFMKRSAEVPMEEARRRAEDVEPGDLSDILFTSGTTGKPKGVMTTHGQNLCCFESWSELVGLREGDRYLVVNPFFHSFGYKAGWLASIMRGVTILPQAVFDVPAVLERIGKDQVSVLPGVPSLYQSILVHPERDTYDLSSLRLASTGAAVIPVDLIRQMRDVLGFDTVVTAYGLTESSGVVTVCRPDDDPETIATTSGCAIPDVEVKCAGPDGGEVSRGEPGEVLVRGYNVMQGYFEDPDETARTIDPDGWMHTGDIGVMDERGYLRITDRMKDMFIMGGFNCYPAEIENLIQGWEAVGQVAVIGVPDERMGEVAMAFAVPARGFELSESEIIAWCREHMANYKAPRYAEVLSELPVNATGKVTKFVLRERAAKRFAS